MLPGQLEIWVAPSPRGKQELGKEIPALWAGWETQPPVTEIAPGRTGRGRGGAGKPRAEGGAPKPGEQEKASGWKVSSLANL